MTDEERRHRDRRMAETSEDVWVSVLGAFDTLGALVGSQAATVERQTENLKNLATAIKERPTKRQALRALTIFNIAALLCLSLIGVFFYRELRQGQQYLVSCTAPGPNPPPDTGHECWDRLVGDSRERQGSSP